MVKNKTYKKEIIVLVVGILFGSLITWFYIEYFFVAPATTSHSVRQNNKSEPFIRPLLAYNTPEMKTASPLKTALKKSVTSALADKNANNISVYYRDLSTGRWFGINQDETFVPASLFKVPLMITYLKDAEKNPNLLQSRIIDTLTEDQNKNETIKPLKSITQGQSYTIEQLLQYMIEYSDNNATVLLFKYINQTTLQEVFSDLDIQVPSKGLNTDFLTVGNYSFFFRVLYNATYLNHEMSEKGLEMLGKIDFNDGIRKSIPSDVPVADKFGEYFLVDNGTINEHQLHDCGIVYHPKHPYILCVMTKGSSLDMLKKVIQDISTLTYQSVDRLE